MKNENFKKRLALALVPILSLTSVIGNVPILPTSVFAVTQDDVYIEEPAVIEEETLEVEEPAVIVEEKEEVEEPAVIVEETEEVEEPAVIEEETEEVEEPEALLNEVPEDLQNLSVVNKDVLNAASKWTITNKKFTSKVEYKVESAENFTPVEATTSSGLDFITIGDTDGVTFKITTDRVQTLKTFTYKVGEADPVPITLTNGEATIANATAKTITAINVEFETIVCRIGDVDFASLTAAIAYINANGSAATDYTIDILDDIPSLALTLPSATKAKSITLKTAKDNGDEEAPQPVPVEVTISNTTLAIPTALVLDNVLLTNSTGVNLTLSAAASALTVKAGGGIEKVVNVSTAADKVITLEDTTKFAITGNLSGKPNIILKDNLEIAGVAAIGELTYSAAAILKFTKTTTTATSTITKIATSDDVAAVLEAGILSLTIGDIDVDTAKAEGFIIKGRQYTATTDKTPVYKITGTISIATGKPIELSVYDKADTKYTSLATIDPTTAIITSVKTETTAAMFKTSNENADKVVYSFYKDGTSLKFGNTFITLNAKVGGAEAADVGTFIRLQDAFTYIDGKDNLTEVILKVSGDIPSHGALTFPATDVTIKSSSEDAQNKISFTGAVKLNANLTLMDIELSNANIKGIAFDLNGKNLTLDTDSKVILNNIVDTTKDVKKSELNIKDAAYVSFLGNINAIGKVNIEDDVIFKGAVANVELIDLKAAKYAYFRGGAITNKLKYVENAKIYLQTTEKGAISKNITIKATENAVTGTGKLKVNAVIDELTAAKDGLPEKITIKTAGGGSEKVIPGAVIVKLFKDSDAKALSFVTDAKNIKAETQTLIATKAGTSIKIAAPKLTLTDTTDPEVLVNENFVTIEEALGVELSGTTYKITITDNIVGADLTNIPAKVTVITAALPTGTDPLLKVVTAKDIGLNGNLIIENLNILAAAKTIGGRTSPSEGVYTYTDATNDLVLSNASLTVKEGYIKDLTLQADAIITFKVSGYLANLKLTNGSTVGKIASIPVDEET